MGGFHSTFSGGGGGGGDLWSDPVNANVEPVTTNTYNLGSPTKKFAALYSSKGFFCDGAGTFAHSGAGGWVGGSAVASSTIRATAAGATAKGHISDSGSGGIIEATGLGAHTNASIDTAGYANHAHTVKASGKSAQAFGHVYSYYGGVGNVNFEASGDGSMVIGSSDLYCYPGYTATGVVKASGRGSMAIGHTYMSTAYGTNASARVEASGIASFALGRASSTAGEALINAAGNGSFAGGSAGTGRKIEAAAGSIAFGQAIGADIVASAINTVQFFQGTNTRSGSLGVGTALQLFGTPGTPSTPADGMVWLNAGYVYIRSNGTSVKIV